MPPELWRSVAWCGVIIKQLTNHTSRHCTICKSLRVMLHIRSLDRVVALDVRHSESVAAIFLQAVVNWPSLRGRSFAPPPAAHVLRRSVPPRSHVEKVAALILDIYLIVPYVHFVSVAMKNQ